MLGAQVFQVMCHGWAGRDREREGGVEGRDGAISRDPWNHLCHDTPSSHCTYYTLNIHSPNFIVH